MNIHQSIDYYRGVAERLSGIETAIGKSVAEDSELILSLNQDQMLLGRNTEGDPFRPGYLEDPYFRDRADAEWYRAMKERLETKHRARISNPIDYPDKNSNTPNLIVTGPFQNGMYLVARDKEFVITSSYEDTPAIEAKYDGKVFGLAPLSVEYYWNYRLGAKLIRYLYGL